MASIALGRKHLVEVSSRNQSGYIYRGITGNQNDSLSISNFELAARIFYVADKTNWERSAWLRQVIYSPDQRSVSEDIELSLAQANGHYDCLILHGSGFQRLKRSVKLIHKLMPSKLLICLLDKAESEEVAKLLNYGVDDVFTLSMSTTEAKARLRAAYRRHASLFDKPASEIAVEVPGIDPELMEWVEEDLPVKRLRLRERVAFRALLSNAERVMRYEELEGLLNLSSSATSRDLVYLRRALKVCISRLRSVLPEYLRIVNIRGEGYSLQFNSNGKIVP